MKQIMIMLLGAVALIALVSCAKSELAGEWKSAPDMAVQAVSKESEALLGSAIGPKTCDFRDDATFSVSVDGKEVNRGTYAFTENKIYIYEDGYDDPETETEFILRVDGQNILDSHGNVVLTRERNLDSIAAA